MEILDAFTDAGIALLVVCGTIIPCAAQAPTADEYQVKAAYMFNFAKFVDWPAQAFDGPADPIVFCVIGRTPLSQSLNDALAGKVIDNRPLILRPLTDTKQVGKCHLMFIGSSDKKQLRQALNQVKLEPVLTVGEAEDFTGEGGIVRFVLDEGRVRLEFNLDAADDAKLRVSSKLLNLGKTVGRAKR